MVFFGFHSVFFRSMTFIKRICLFTFRSDPARRVVLNLIGQVLQKNMEIFHLATIDIDTPSFNKTSLLHKINRMPRKRTLPNPRMSRQPHKPLFSILRQKVLYQILPYLCIPNHIVHRRCFVIQNCLLFLKGGFSALKTTVVMTIGLAVSLAQKHDELLGLILPMIQVYNEFGGLKTFTNLRFFFPNLRIKSLCKSQYSFI